MACPDPLLYLDDQNLALQIQLEEVDAQFQSYHGKWKEDNPPDSVVAFTSFEAELKKCIDVINDAKLAQSMSAAVEADSEAIEKTNFEELQAVNDQSFALRFDEDGSMPSVSTSQPENEPIACENTSCIGSDDSYGTTIAGPSGQSNDQQDIAAKTEDVKPVECIVCGESILPHDAIHLECGDVYCRVCLKSFFLRVAKDETLFPPKCHRQSIDISTIEGDFSPEELKLYRAAELEFTSTDRIYCAERTCGVFIPTHQRNAAHGSCDICASVTCIQCKQLAHDGNCGVDETRQELLEFAHEQGWKSCFGCGEMIFRHEGCNHMTCRCSTEFCYRCGIKWKDCDCGDWEHELLDQRAQHVVDREALQPLAPAVRQQRVAFMARELRANHRCNRRGGFQRIDFKWTHNGRTAICWSVKTAGAIEYNWIEGLKRRFALMLCILMMMVCVGYAKQSHGTTVVLLNCERLDGCLDQISEHVDRTV